MKKLPKKEEIIIDSLAHQVWGEVVYSMDQYTHDSTVSKFFMPEQIVSHCRVVAGAFAQLHYSPIPSTKEIYKTRLFSLFYLSMTCGVQVFLKERAIFTNYTPYYIQTDTKIIRELKQRITKQLEEGVEIFSPLDEVLELFISQLHPIKQKIKKNAKGREFNDELFDKLLPVTLIWGYLFAKEMVLT